MTLSRFARPYEVNRPERHRLEVQNISLSFGGVNALTSVSLTCEPGEILAIIGPNGAGKTSLLNCICSLYRPQRGRILYDNRNLVTTSPHQLPKLGIARTFQNIELFSHMTVLDNLMLGRHIHMKKNIFTSMLYWGPGQREEIYHREFVEQVIDLLEIQHIRKQQVGSLAYGLQKRVELGRALAMNPGLLLLDEPMAGMNVEEKEDMARFILDINEEWGVTIILIEHDMGVVMDISDRVAVLDFGRLIALGTPQEVRANPQVIQAYLGQEHALIQEQ
ncbi:MAG: ABC transporter ATP-binding protein [Chloroflexota bacterium]|nr:ABC transporter ATP-binding protein [Chloroflexota bacterium]NOG63475.1 ABC transporter ATP-binding protein [Chloroflexota bacterium]GIK62334.1 MAG: ABC transporter ATP-binding protein [Chloroflexota bacterium]